MDFSTALHCSLLAPVQGEACFSSKAHSPLRNCITKRTKMTLFFPCCNYATPHLELSSIQPCSERPLVTLATPTQLAAPFDQW